MVQGRLPTVCSRLLALERDSHPLIPLAPAGLLDPPPLQECSIRIPQLRQPEDIGGLAPRKKSGIHGSLALNEASLLHCCD
jgi:hypothetical protein